MVAGINKFLEKLNKKYSTKKDSEFKLAIYIASLSRLGLTFSR